VTDNGPASVILVGFQDQGNLGVGYLASALMANGHHVEVVDVKEGAPRVAALASARRPHVVGFSLIFQYYLEEFASLARDLRARGVPGHFTIGGHFPSLCQDDVLDAIPELDSVVRFEGERTLVELAERLVGGRDWQDVHGISYREDGRTITTPLRPLIEDLDSIPHPWRPRPPEEVLGVKALPMLASRGCARRCSFCSIHVFYRSAPGRLVRTRSAANVVEEMATLYTSRGARIFLFQDDDFPLWGKPGRLWAEDLVREIERRGLVGRVIWKISSRVDDVDPDLFATFRDAGLYLVYLGLESGTDRALDALEKGVTVEQNRAAVSTLKRLGLMFEYGFMLFDPSSTFESVRANASFLREVVGDGSAGATFCRMLPYGGTPIRDRLMAEGRLRGSITQPDYDFLDRRVNEYHPLLDAMAGPWIHGDGASHQLNWAWHEVAVLDRMFPPLDNMASYRAALAGLTSRSNDELLSLVESSARAFEQGDRSWFEPRASRASCDGIITELLALRNGFIAHNQGVLLDALAAPRMNQPIVSPSVF
jgi:anaerobic magnesium-protoporphyrin IX monomethyl ester cyclase